RHPRHIPSFPTRRSSDLGTCHGARKSGLLLVAGLAAVVVSDDLARGELGPLARDVALGQLAPRRYKMLATAAALRFALTATVRRSEEHTSELQSPYDLVC